MTRRAWLMGPLALALGCDRPASPTPAPAPAPAVADGKTTKTFALKGVVRKVDAGSGEVSIAHEAIPGLMPKMTMPFVLDDKALLVGVRTGDSVEGALRVEYQGAEVKEMDLDDLSVTGHGAGPDPTEGPPPGPSPEVLKPGDPVPDFGVTTQEGRPLRLSDLRGEVVVLTFIYTRCPQPEFCPATDAKFAALDRRISAVPDRSDRVRLLSISFDPEHDTPEVLASHAARRGAKPPSWTFAAISHEELGRVAGAFGLTYVPGTREIDHNLRTAVVGPDGRLDRLEAGPSWKVDDLLKTVLDRIRPARP